MRARRVRSISLSGLDPWLTGWVLLRHGRLGTGGTEDQLQPVRVGGPLAGCRAVLAAAGGVHTVVVTADGGLFAFGRRGANGIDGQRDVLAPERVVLPKGARAQQASTGWFYTVVGTSRGEVFQFGLQNHRRAWEPSVDNVLPARVVSDWLSDALKSPNRPECRACGGSKARRGSPFRRRW